ncbi:MAG: tail fiber assembly protein [Negativicutes bacterium]|nr:tail fiber assembly protein [Negativicutes bacterium]
MYYALFDDQGNRITSYVPGINCDTPPVGAIEISEADQELYCAGQYIRDASTGKPVLKPGPTPEEITANNLIVLRAERNRRLSTCDWTQSDDTPLADATKAAWKIYRQELRDLPANTVDFTSPVWPVPPLQSN